MWKQWIKDYFTFTRKERRAVIVLLVLILFFAFIPKIWPLLLKEGRGAPVLTSIEPGISGAKPNPEPVDSNEALDILYRPLQHSDEDNAVAGELFFFDPNTLSAEGWKKLGIRAKTVATIQNFISKGGRFRKPEDLSKIYGLKQKDYERILPFARIKDDEMKAISKAEFIRRTESERKDFGSAPESNEFLRSIEINSADTSAFISLPGIGSKLAQRIIRFRDKLGGFYSVSQIAEVYGLPDSTFQKIQSKLVCDSSGLRKININSADLNSLKGHPYIKWNVANAIVQNRNQNGAFTKPDDLLRINIITSEILKSLIPYLDFH